MMLAVALTLGVACGTDTVVAPDETAPSSTIPPTTSLTPPPPPGPSTTQALADQPPSQLLVIGDSIAGQLFHTLDQRSSVRGGPEVRYLLTAGPRFVDDWPEPLGAFVSDPAETAAVTSFGVWLALPPDHVADDLDEQSDAETIEEIVAFLRPVADLAGRGTTLHLLADIADPAADAHIQAANALITAAGDRLRLPVQLLRPRRSDGPTVSIDGIAHPIRNGADATHFCAAAALVMADEILDDLAVAARPPTSGDLEALLAATADTQYFTAAGCEPSAG